MADFIKISNTSSMSLGELKEYRYNEIDYKTGELIKLGFVYNTITFSLSENAQNNLLGVYSTKELLTYPFEWSSKDDSQIYSIVDATEMATFFMTALGAKKAHQDSGRTLKNQITNATDIASVNAIVDAR